MVRLIVTIFLFLTTSTYAQSWVDIEYGNKPIPVKFFKSNKEGKSPTVLLVHGTAGPGMREHNWAKFLASEGYNALIVDFKSGRFDTVEERDRAVNNNESLLNRTHSWLVSQPEVDQNNISYMGFSLGGFLGFWIPDRGLFKNYILFYPSCYRLSNLGVVRAARTTPTLVVWGTRDSLGDGIYCPKMVDNIKGKIYSSAIPNADHGFDGTLYIPSYREPASPTGRASVEPNEEATKQAQAVIRQFLNASR